MMEKGKGFGGFWWSGGARSPIHMSNKILNFGYRSPGVLYGKFRSKNRGPHHIKPPYWNKTKIESKIQRNLRKIDFKTQSEMKLNLHFIKKYYIIIM